MARASGPAAPPGAPQSLEEWRQAVEAGLDGASFERRLVTKTPEGLRIEPLHPDRGTAEATVPVRSGETWLRHEELDLSEVDDPGPRLRSAVDRGVDGLRLRGVTETGLAELRVAIEGLGLGLHPTEGAGWDPETLQISTLAEQGRGAGEPLQVALALAGGLGALRTGESAGVPLGETCAKLEFEVGLDTDLFLSIASLRALRLGWARLVAACGGSGVDQRARLHARTSERCWSARDPWGNLLRGTTASFAAAVGGADSILTLPFDRAVGRSDDAARRLASNTQALLEEESHLAAVLDPAAGSGYLEQLTQDVAARAWEQLREIERLGGLGTEAARARIEAWIAERGAVERDQVATRQRPLVGVSEFPNLSEALLEREAPGSPSDVQRIAQPFEDLHRRCEAQRTVSGQHPRAFLANVGAPAEFRPRAAFTSNFLAVAGIEALENDGFEGPAQACAAFGDSGARLAVICSSDERYRECAVELAGKLRAAGATVLLAGRPGEQLEEWRAAGVTDFIHLGCDALAILTRLLETLEVPA